MRRSTRLGAILIFLIGMSSCENLRESAASSPQDSARADSTARARQDSINRTLPGYVVDSILPMAEELRRFRAAVGGDSVTRLRGGAGTRDSLIRKFVRALSAADTAALRGMQVNAQEFASLVYPESPYTKAPYRQAPGLVWSQIQNPGSSGLTRLLRRLGGQSLRYGGSTCASKSDRQGSNIIWTECAVMISEPGQPRPRRRKLFGSIIERDNHFKFVSYVNEF